MIMDISTAEREITKRKPGEAEIEVRIEVSHNDDELAHSKASEIANVVIQEIRE